MSRFTEKASARIDRMSDEQIVRLIKNQSRDLRSRDNVLDSVTSGFILVDSTGKVLYSNKYLQFLMDINPNKSKINEFVMNSEVLSFMRDCIKKRSDDVDMFYEHSNPAMGKMYIRLISIAVKQTDQILFLVRDFTIIRKMMDEFKKNESLASMTTMAAGVAHEIKNPLASISIYLQLLRKKLDKDGSITKEDAAKSLSVIEQEIERLNKIAVDFLFAVKPMAVNQTMTNINDVVKKTLDVCKAEIADCGVKLEVNLATTLPKTFIDSPLIEQCILNLVRNALQAFDKKSENKKISISTYIEADNVMLSVADNGCGMSESTMARIFEPYYTTKASGTGLGLTNIYKILKEHNGQITVKSEEGSGSVFTMQIPVPQSERFRIGQGMV